MIQNAKTACYKQITVPYNLVKLKYGRHLLVMKSLLSSDAKLLTNNCKNCTKFIRAFSMCPWSGLVLKGLLEIAPTDRGIHAPLIASKFMSYKECTEVQKDMPKSGLKNPRIANLGIVRVLGIILF